MLITQNGDTVRIQLVRVEDTQFGLGVAERLADFHVKASEFNELKKHMIEKLNEFEVKL